MLHGLAGGDSLVGVAVNDREPVTLGVLGEGAFLGREGETVEVLLLGAYTDVDCTAFDFNCIHGITSLTANLQSGLYVFTKILIYCSIFNHLLYRRRHIAYKEYSRL